MKSLGLAWVEFHGAAQVAQLRRTVTKKGKKTVGVVYLITQRPDGSTRPPLAAWVRGHWHIENKLHWARRHLPRRQVPGQNRERATGDGNAAGSLAISLLRLDGHGNIAAANRHHARDPQRTLKLLQTA